MVLSLKDLKSNRKASFEKLVKDIEGFSSNKKKTYDDRNDGFWYPRADKAGNGKALIRFLPTQEDGGSNMVRTWSYAFQGPKGWYIENSLASLGDDSIRDPAAEVNHVLWNLGSDAKGCPYRKLARDQGRKLEYVSNILVEKDYANPENNGKVFYFRYGKKIFDKINSAMFPSDEEVELGAEKIDPFDLWDGAPFFLSFKKEDGFRNYNDSKFMKSGPVANKDEKIEEIYKQTKSVDIFLDPSNFKEYGVLKERLLKILGISSFDEDEVASLVPHGNKSGAATRKVTSSKPTQNRQIVEESVEETDTSGVDIDDDDSIQEILNKLKG